MSERTESAQRLTLVGASAGSGKTFRITEEVIAAISPDSGAVDLEGLVGVTYTRKAAAELAARIRRTLVKNGAYERTQRLPLAYLGTVHAVCLRLLQEFAIDAGLSPHLDVLPGSEARLLRQALEWGLEPTFKKQLEDLAAWLQIRWDPKTDRADWLSPVQDIMTLARSNRIPPTALDAMAERSVEGLLALLGPAAPDGNALDRALLEGLTRAAHDLEEINDGQQNTAGARDLIDELLLKAKAGPLRWSDWITVQKLEPGKAARAAVSPLILIAARVHEHPRLHDELRRYTLGVYAAAKRGLVAYDDWKKRRRVVDFVDMIDRALTLLEQPAVADELRKRLALLVVDEFQDTSPVQLALFASMHALAKRSTWVGDRKQCIFEFAGADPTLMEALTKWVSDGKGQVEQLPFNRRSRPELVETCSDLFAAAFARHGYRPEEVRVTAKRSTDGRLADLPPLGVWALAAKNRPEETAALAEGVRRLLQEPGKTPVVDRATGEVRDLRPGDVALLVATNAEAKTLAEALAMRGVRAAVARAGLLATPEGTLVEAALRALLDPRDDQSRAILDALTGFQGKDPDAWLNARLRDVAARRTAENGEHPPPPSRPSDVVARVEALGKELEGAAPSEALDRVLSALDVVTIACRWPDPEQRLANLDALRAMSAAYEERCKQESEAATVGGLLRYFDQAAEEVLVRDEMLASDDQHMGAGDGAVTILTYHRAKGLEWPVVVLGSLNKKEKRDAFEVSPETDRPAFDPSDPLAGRWIRYWPSPFGQRTATRLAELAAASPVGRAVAEREERERVRLLYVGFTRARDHLVLAVRVGKKGPAVNWLGELCDAQGKPLLELPLDEAGTGLGHVSAPGPEGGRAQVPARVWNLGTGGDDPPRLERTDGTLGFARPETVAGERPRYWISPSRAAVQWPDMVVPSVLEETESMGERLPLGQAKEVSWDVVGNAVHAFLAADAPGMADNLRHSRAEQLLAASGLLAVLGPDALLRAGDQLRRWVERRWPAANWHREVPVKTAIMTPHGMRSVSGTIDLLLVLPEGVVIVDHKSYPGAPSTWIAKAREFAPQMGAYAHALRAAGLSVLEQWIHFTVGAGAVRLAVSQVP